MRRAVFLLAAALSGTASAQSSQSFVAEEYTFTAGSYPGGGIVLASASFEVTQAALGDVVSTLGLVSASFGTDTSFAGIYAPPGEVQNLRFLDPTTLAWDAESSARDYSLYRDTLTSLPGLEFGSCVQSGITAESTTDTDEPAVMTAFFYLVTVENRLDEEGTKGFQSNGAERQGTVCP